MTTSKITLWVLISSIIALIVFSTTFLLSCNTPFENKKNTVYPKVNIEKTRLKAKLANEFCANEKLNTDYCILIDMSLHSGVKRFFVWDFNTDTITHSFLVGHGCCNNDWNDDESKDNPKFSNLDGSHCSSLGKYKIGERGFSNWGVNIKYVLHGLESTNNNAQKRIVVFHSWEVVSDTEIYPNGTPEGWGCPTVSNNSFKIIDPMLKESKKSVLMWIYN